MTKMIMMTKMTTRGGSAAAAATRSFCGSTHSQRQSRFSRKVSKSAAREARKQKRTTTTTTSSLITTISLATTISPIIIIDTHPHLEEEETAKLEGWEEEELAAYDAEYLYRTGCFSPSHNFNNTVDLADKKYSNGETKEEEIDLLRWIF